MIETIYQRRSIRKFTNELINDEVINQLLKCAMAAPSARNMCPWEFYVIRNKEVQKQLQNVSPNFNYQSNVIIIVCGNTDKSLTKNPNDFWIQDCSAAIENILLAATKEGVGSLWCGIYPVMERVEKVRKIINVSSQIIPLGLIHLGMAAEEKEPRTRYDQACVHFIN